MDSLHRVQSFRLLSMSPLQASKPVWAPLGLQLPLWHNHFLQPGTARAAVCSISAPPVHSMGCRGLTCITTFCSLGCRGISALAPLNTYSLPWPWCLRGCFNCFFFSRLSSLFHSCCAASFTLSKVHLHRDTTGVTALVSFGQWWIHCRASWNWLWATQGQPGAALTEHTSKQPQCSSPCAPKCDLPCLYPRLFLKVSWNV